MVRVSEHQGLKRFIAGRSPATSETVVWKPQTLEFTMTTYLASEMVPDDLVTSARCIVVRDGKVLTVTDRDGVMHILPGGRREPGETLRETALREVREETGLEVVGLRQVGVMLFEHLTSKPKDYPYPYPHFMQVVFAAAPPSGAEVVCDDE